MKFTKNIFIILVLCFFLTNTYTDSKKEPSIDLRGIKVYVPLKRIVVKGVVNMQSGLIELLATAPKGKEHESILILNCNPSLLQTAFLLIGLQKGGGGVFQGEKETLHGDSLYVYVRWKEGKKEKKVRAEDLILEKKYNRTMPHVRWVFTGSRFAPTKKRKQPVFAANVTGSLVATFYDPDAILNNPLPGRIDDTSYYANDKILPKRGTSVEVIFTTQEMN